MKAILIDHFGDKGVLKYDDIETPAPKPGELLIRIAVCGAGFGDVMLRSGGYPDEPVFPITLGFDASGTVDAVGDGVPDTWLGRRVMVAAPNCNADYVVVPVPFATPLPDSVSDEAAAAAATNYASAYHLLHTVNRVEEGQTMLVYAAAGGVGSALIQLGKLAGLHVIGLTSTPSKCDFVLAQGADCAINYNDENVVEKINKFTDGKGVDSIMNSVAGDTLNRDFQVVAPLGQVTLFGMSAGMPSPDLTGQFLMNFRRSIRLQMFSLATLAMHYPEAITKSLETIVKLIAEDKIEPHVHEILPLAETAQAHHLIESGQVLGKVLLKP